MEESSSSDDDGGRHTALCRRRLFSISPWAAIHQAVALYLP